MQCFLIFSKFSSLASFLQCCMRESGGESYPNAKYQHIQADTAVCGRRHLLLAAELHSIFSLVLVLYILKIQGRRQHGEQLRPGKEWQGQSLPRSYEQSSFSMKLQRQSLGMGTTACGRCQGHEPLTRKAEAWCGAGVWERLCVLQMTAPSMRWGCQSHLESNLICNFPWWVCAHHSLLCPASFCLEIGMLRLYSCLLWTCNFFLNRKSQLRGHHDCQLRLDLWALNSFTAITGCDDRE